MGKKSETIRLQPSAQTMGYGTFAKIESGEKPIIDSQELEELYKWIEQIYLNPPSLAKFGRDSFSRQSNCTDEFYHFFGGIQGELQTHRVRQTVPNRDELIGLLQKCILWPQQHRRTEDFYSRHVKVVDALNEQISSLQGMRDTSLPAGAKISGATRKPKA
ncbi:MAG: hypothetical protein A3E83_05675 [Gammaproteobacteria bacterium RIFCSPHIGHO2_12_FULL_41_20]|nr:MAG: hypothetical protein A3E83_05675 [Gammaproteobacteria bacterium RIFCSPHIGHO2_12_FULL_41_20]